jgi:hypothetical protein
VQENDSNAQDTYYGLAILSLLDSPFPNVDRTTKWLREFRLGSIYSYYNVGKALTLCGEDLDQRFRKYVTSTIASKRHFGSADVYVEVVSEFQIVHMVLELADLLGIDTAGHEIADWLFQFKNEDGGFGTHQHSNINSTYYAIASLGMLRVGKESLQRTVAFLRTCENPHGGFTVVPNSYAPYLEHTYYGVIALNALGENCRFPSQTIDFVLKCQNVNGGFARADLGISTFENTFQALSVMQKLVQ